MTTRRIWLLIWYFPVLILRFFYGAVEGACGEVDEFISDWKAKWNE